MFPTRTALPRSLYTNGDNAIARLATMAATECLDHRLAGPCAVLAAGFVYWRNMSETRDKRRKGDLDLFVLALISSGVSTPYALQKKAGLSPGATIPAIQRLLQAGLIRHGKPGHGGGQSVESPQPGKDSSRAVGGSWSTKARPVTLTQISASPCWQSRRGTLIPRRFGCSSDPGPSGWNSVLIS